MIFSSLNYAVRLRVHRRLNLALFGVCCLALSTLLFSGCQSFNLTPPAGLFGSGEKSSANGGKSSASKSAADASGKAKSPVASTDPLKPLMDENWVLAIALPDAETPPPHRWRHGSLEEILDRPADKQPDWNAALKSDRQMVAVNAAIALSRLGQGHPEEELATAVRAPDLKLPIRRAAAEALGDVHTEPAQKTLRELIDQYGRFTGEYRSRYVPELHAELIGALAHQPGGAADRRITDALKSPAGIVKREALTDLASVPANQATDQAAELPPLAIDLTTDADSLVRIAALRLLVARHHPQAADKTMRAVSDYNMPVRMAAIELLGEIGDEQGHSQLQHLAADHAELVRVAAVKALAKLDDRESVETAATDASWRVRRAVAVSLARHPDRRGATLARQFLTDASVEVQREVVHMTTKWPVAQAGPILLAGMESPNYETRKDSATLLADRWPAAAGFPIDAPAPRRAELTAQLQTQWTATYGNIDQAAIAAKSHAGSAPVSAEQKQAVAQAIGVLLSQRTNAADQAAAVTQLSELGDALVPILELLVEEHPRPLPVQIYRDVLPRCGKEFDLVNQLAEPNQTSRRSAIAGLAKLSQEKNLSILSLTRIAELLTAENDPVVWMSAFKLIEHDPREPAQLLAAAAMTHPASDVRRRACAYFTAYPDSHRTELLAGALSDSNVSVLHAVCIALAEFPPLADTAPVERLLAAPDHFLRIDAAMALARWNLESGRAALERLAEDDDPQVRRTTAQVIGKLNDSAMLPTLVKLLDDQQDIRRASLLSLKSITGSENPPGDNSSAGGIQQASLNATAGSNAAGSDGSTTLADQARRWKEWFRQSGPR
ncbi:MAG TPA: HEAT repeat domain-containing protein [Pirellulales bacterium]